MSKQNKKEISKYDPKEVLKDLDKITNILDIIENNDIKNKLEQRTKKHLDSEE